jgi:hypothetical protein
MDRDIDDLFQAAPFAPPAGFADRVAGLARGVPQERAAARPTFDWRLAPLAAAAVLATAQLLDFAFFAFVATAAR